MTTMLEQSNENEPHMPQENMGMRLLAPLLGGVIEHLHRLQEQGDAETVAEVMEFEGVFDQLDELKAIREWALTARAPNWWGSEWA